MSEALSAARTREAVARARLAEAVAEQARARREAERLEGRSILPGADPAMAEAAQQQRTLVERATSSIDAIRAQLRRAEADVVTIEAASDLDRSSPAG